MNKNFLTQKILTLETSIRKVHELLHQHKIEEAENILHNLICGNESGVRAQLFEGIGAANKVSQFDTEFRKLCERHRIESAYVAQVLEEQPNGMIRVSWHSGGIGWMSKIIDSFSDKFSENLKERLKK